MGQAEQNETIAKTVESPHAQDRGSRGTYFIIGGVVLILVIATGVYAYTRTNTNHKTANRPAVTKTAYDKANELALAGNDSQAQATLDAQLKTATTPEQKGALYEQKASIAISTNNYAEGLKYAQQAEALHATRNSAYLIAESAELNGDKATAIKYYQIVISRTNPNLDDYTIPQLQTKIKNLQG